MHIVYLCRFISCTTTISKNSNVEVALLAPTAIGASQHLKQYMQMLLTQVNLAENWGWRNNSRIMIPSLMNQIPQLPSIFRK